MSGTLFLPRYLLSPFGSSNLLVMQISSLFLGDYFNLHRIKVSKVLEMILGLLEHDYMMGFIPTPYPPWFGPKIIQFSPLFAWICVFLIWAFLGVLLSLCSMTSRDYIGQLHLRIPKSTLKSLFYISMIKPQFTSKKTLILGGAWLLESFWRDLAGLSSPCVGKVSTKFYNFFELIWENYEFLTKCSVSVGHT